MLTFRRLWNRRDRFVDQSVHARVFLHLALGPLVVPRIGVGPYWSEPELIAFARHVARLTDGFVKPAGY